MMIDPKTAIESKFLIENRLLNIYITCHIIQVNVHDFEVKELIPSINNDCRALPPKTFGRSNPAVVWFPSAKRIGLPDCESHHVVIRMKQVSFRLCTFNVAIVNFVFAEIIINFHDTGGIDIFVLHSERGHPRVIFGIVVLHGSLECSRI